MWMILWALGLAEAGPLDQVFVQADGLLQEIGVPRESRRELAAIAATAVQHVASPAELTALAGRVRGALAGERVDAEALEAVRRDVVRRVDDGSAELLQAVIPMLDELSSSERLDLLDRLEDAVAERIRG